MSIDIFMRILVPRQSSPTYYFVHHRIPLIIRLLNFDTGIDLNDKYRRSKESDCACINICQPTSSPPHLLRTINIRKLTSQYKPQKANQTTIPQIEYITCETPETQLPNPIHKRIQHNIRGTTPCRKECPPLPMVVFRTEEEVGQEHCYR